jgi:uncharacterized membrane protein YfhO
MQHNTMWIDGLILLPLLALGVERIVKYKKPILYICSLALTLMANYYIGYMSCIFVLLYFFYFFISSCGTENYNICGEKYHFFRSLSRMAVYSVIAIGIASFMLIAAYYSLTFGKTEFTDPEFSFIPKDISIIQFIAKMYPGAYDTVYPNGLPWIYSGILALITLPLFFLAKKIKWQEKFASAAFVAIMVISMYIPAIDMAWHGFQAPNWLNYRYSFMFSFFLLLLAAKAVTLIREIGYRSVIVSSGIVAFMAILIQVLDPKYEKHTSEMVSFFDDVNGLWISLICVAAYAALLAVMAKYRANSEKLDNLALIMAFVICAETFLTGVFYTQKLDDDVVISSYDSYHDFYDKHSPAVEYVKENSKEEFYRFEKTFTRNVTDYFVFDINGLSSSTSTLYEDVIELLRDLGLKADSHWSEYGGSSVVTDSFFGIRYMLALHYADSYEPYTPIPQYVKSLQSGLFDLNSPDEKKLYEYYFDNKYSLYYENDKTLVYENPYALSLAFASSKDISNVSLDDYDNPFDRMNAIINSILPQEEPVNVYKALDYSFDPTYIESTVETADDHIWYHGFLRDESSAFVTYNLTAESDGNIYAFFPTNYAREVSVAYCKNGATDENGDKIRGINTIYQGGADIAPIINLGYFEKGDTLSVQLLFQSYDGNDKSEFIIKRDAQCFYSIDYDAFSDAFTSIAENQLKISEFDDDYLKGDITVASDATTVFSTIPYDSGWQVSANGEKLETYPSLTCMLTFDLPSEGDYTITMKYSPSIYRIGAIVSLFFVLILAGICVYAFFYKRNKIKLGKNTKLFALANVFLPTSDALKQEYSLIELEIKEEIEEEQAKKDHKKLKRKKKSSR